MALSIAIKPTDDGSPTLFNADAGEHYHSIYGARTESEHVFINNGLKNCQTNSSISILEVGLGTGLNVMLTALHSDKYNSIAYDAVELHPIDIELAQKFAAAFDSEERNLLEKIHATKWNEAVKIVCNFSLRKISGDINNITLDRKYDLVYFDAFSPETQPEMWTNNLFSDIYNNMNENGILVTYCAKGIVKQNLRAAGFVVRRVAGPPHKHHMLIAKRERVTPA